MKQSTTVCIHFVSENKRSGGMFFTVYLPDKDTIDIHYSKTILNKWEQTGNNTKTDRELRQRYSTITF